MGIHLYGVVWQMMVTNHNSSCTTLLQYLLNLALKLVSKNMSLRLNKHHDMKTYARQEVQLHTFLTFDTRRKWVVSFAAQATIA